MTATHIPGKSDFHPAIQVIAKTVSIIFHPLFIPVYGLWLLLYYTNVFPGVTGIQKSLLLIRFLVMYSLFPLVTVLIAKGLGFVKSIYLRDAKDRIIPYIACGVYYFWMWWVLKNQPDQPRELVKLGLAIFVASSAGLIVNSFIKVSMHGMSVGVMLTFLLLMALHSEENIGYYLSFALLAGGVISTARLINSDHDPIEVYLGIFIGVVSQLISWWIG
jgi:hypothetical protein